MQSHDLTQGGTRKRKAVELLVDDCKDKVLQSELLKNFILAFTYSTIFLTVHLKKTMS